MKHSKIFRILAIAITLSLLVILLPAAPALAYDNDIDLDPPNGEIDEYFYVEGDDWPHSQLTTTPYSYSEVDIYFSSQEADTDDDIDDEVTIYEKLKSDVLVDEDGDFRKRVRVPAELTDGDEDEDVYGGRTYYVYATYDGKDNIEAVAEFTVTGIKQITPKEGTVGTEVDIEGVGFDKREDITVFYDGDEVDIESGDVTVGSDYNFTSTIIIPESTAGAHTITVTDESENEGEAEFTVEPESDISATSGRIGDRVTVTGTGFGSSADVTVTFGDEEVATGQTDSEGNFSIAFDVPSVGAGTYDVEAEDEDGNSGKARFTMTTDISISPVTSQASPGYVGMDMTISGTGFIPNHEITITYASTPVVFTTTSEDDGSFSYTFKVPKSAPGEHTITASDGTNTLEVAFFIESTAPAIPRPLLPAMGIKAEQPVVFDWEDVTDPSGVTYTLQLARNENFTDIVLERELTQSTYTMTEAEELESTKKDEPYWWRVRAIDGAGNMSGWTGAGSFHVGFVFAMPNWAIYLLIGLGGLLLFFIGFFVGRKTGYAY